MAGVEDVVVEFEVAVATEVLSVTDGVEDYHVILVCSAYGLDGLAAEWLNFGEKVVELGIGTERGVHNFISQEAFFGLVSFGHLAPDFRHLCLLGLSAEKPWIATAVVAPIAGLSTRGCLHVENHIKPCRAAPFHEIVEPRESVLLCGQSHKVRVGGKEPPVERDPDGVRPTFRDVAYVLFRNEAVLMPLPERYCSLGSCNLAEHQVQVPLGPDFRKSEQRPVRTQPPRKIDSLHHKDGLVRFHQRAPLHINVLRRCCFLRSVRHSLFLRCLGAGGHA